MTDSDLGLVSQRLQRAAAAPKCAACGCAQATVLAIRSASQVPIEIAGAADALAERLEDVRYECLGCKVCWPAEALGQLTDLGLVDPTPTCPTEAAEPRPGWPPLPGQYTVQRWDAPVAVCTLGDADLADAVAAYHHPAVAIVGVLATENLGIERLVHNAVSNPNIRFLLVTGTETRQRIGHLPGASLLALAANGTDTTGRIIGAPGRRPVLSNVPEEAITAFRTVIETVDLIGCTDTARIVEVAAEAAALSPGPAQPCAIEGGLAPTTGYVAARMTPDPAGYFVIYPDPVRRVLRLEHYSTAGVLDAVIEGPSPSHCYTAAIDQGLLTRLDHAAYLGRELTRAESCLAAGRTFAQDAAPQESQLNAKRTSACCSEPAAPTPDPPILGG